MSDLQPDSQANRRTASTALCFVKANKFWVTGAGSVQFNSSGHTFACYYNPFPCVVAPNCCQFASAIYVDSFMLQHNVGGLLASCYINPKTLLKKCHLKTHCRRIELIK